MLDISGITVRYGQHTILEDVSLTVREGEWLMVVGPNGAGKSTLLSAIAQSVPSTGTVRLHGKDVRRMKPRERAKCLGTLTQSHHVGYAFTVEEIVQLGRYAYQGALGSRGEADVQAIQDALAFTGMDAYRTQSVLTLSGGELQRAFLAQLFAQNPDLLLLDEPTNHLDLAYQKQVFALVQNWLKQPGKAAVSVVHDLSLARRYGTQALLLSQGQAIAQGDVHKALSRKHLKQVYGMDVHGWMQEMLSQWQEPSAAD